MLSNAEWRNFSWHCTTVWNSSSWLGQPSKSLHSSINYREQLIHIQHTCLHVQINVYVNIAKCKMETHFKRLQLSSWCELNKTLCNVCHNVAKWSTIINAFWTINLQITGKSSPCLAVLRYHSYHSNNQVAWRWRQKRCMHTNTVQLITCWYIDQQNICCNAIGHFSSSIVKLITKLDTCTTAVSQDTDSPSNCEYRTDSTCFGQVFPASSFDHLVQSWCMLLCKQDCQLNRCSSQQ